MHARVRSTSRITPSMVRVVLGDGDLDGFAMPGEPSRTPTPTSTWPSRPRTLPTSHVGGLRPRAGAGRPPADVQPARRRYTVRTWDEAAKELTLDFVVHGDDGSPARGRRPSSPATSWSSRVLAAATAPTPRPTGT